MFDLLSKSDVLQKFPHISNAKRKYFSIQFIASLLLIWTKRILFFT